MTARSDEGFTLVESAVASTILIIVLLMTYMIGTTVVKTAVQGTRSGVAAETAQSQVAVLEQYLQGAITPAGAATEYPSVSNLCTGGSQNAVQAAYDYQLELCTAPSSHVTCSSSNSTSTGTQCPQLYEIKVASCSATNSECNLEIQDMSVNVNGVNPIIWTLSTFRCPSACQSDVTTPAYQGNGASPSFPYLFQYYDSTGTTQWNGSSPSSIQSVHLDLENLTSSPSETVSTQAYTEIDEAVWLTGAAAPSA